MRQTFTTASPFLFPAIIAASVFGLGCGCPTIQEFKADRKVTGQLRYQLPGAAPTTGDLAPFSTFGVFPGASGAYPDGEIAFDLEPDEPSRVTNPAAFAARLVVPLVPAGASEIELGDDAASLTAYTSAPTRAVYHGLTGHLSIQWIDSTCGTQCPLHMRGTVTVSATGPTDEVFEVTSGTFVAADGLYDTGRCQD